MNLTSSLLSAGTADSVAVLAEGDAITYGELRRRVESLAAALLDRGSRHQDRVALWAENGIFFVVGYLAVIRAGLVAVPIQSEIAPESARRILSDAGIRIVLASRRSERRAREAAGAETAVIDEDAASGIPAASGSFPDVDSRRDLAALMFTSGSTGAPKGVMVTHENILCNTRDIVEYMGLTATDRCLVVLPFSYCFGLSLLHTHLAVGATIVINNTFRYPETVLTDLRDRACTGFAGVPSTYQVLLRKSRFTQSEFPALRWLQQAGGPLSDSCIREITEALPAVRFYVMYGQTEATARLSYLSPERLPEKIGSIGRGLASTRLDVIGPSGTPVRPGSDEIGEIVAQGDNVTLGYWGDPIETARYFHDGRLRTGDLARIDADGFIFLVDRERDIIKAGGNRLSPREIEDVIAEVTTALNVAVVGVPHDVLGEAVVAFVASEPEGAHFEHVLDHCRRRLHTSKVPEAVVHLSAFPHHESGKIAKGELKRIAADVLAPAGVRDGRIVMIERKAAMAS